MPVDPHLASFVKADPGYFIFRVKCGPDDPDGKWPTLKERELEMHPVVAFSFSLDDGTTSKKPSYVSKPMTALQGLRPTSLKAYCYWDVALLTPDGHVFCYEPADELLPAFEHVVGSVLDVKSFIQIYDNAASTLFSTHSYTISDQVRMFGTMRTFAPTPPRPSIAPIAPIGSLSSPPLPKPKNLKKTRYEGLAKRKSPEVYDKSASAVEETEKSRRGGARPGAGRPKKLIGQNFFEGL